MGLSTDRRGLCQLHSSLSAKCALCSAGAIFRNIHSPGPELNFGPEIWSLSYQPNTPGSPEQPDALLFQWRKAGWAPAKDTGHGSQPAINPRLPELTHREGSRPTHPSPLPHPYVYTCTDRHIHTHAHTYTDTHVHTHIQKLILTHVHSHICRHIFSHVFTHVHMCTYRYSDMHIHIQAHTDTHSLMYTHRHLHSHRQQGLAHRQGWPYELRETDLCPSSARVPPGHQGVWPRAASELQSPQASDFAVRAQRGGGVQLPLVASGPLCTHGTLQHILWPCTLAVHIPLRGSHCPYFPLTHLTPLAPGGS